MLSESSTIALLTIAEAGEGYLTQSAGQELMNGQLIDVTQPARASADDATAFHVTITEEGQEMVATLSGAAPPVAAPPVPQAPSPVVSVTSDFAISSDIALPVIKRGGGGNRGPRKEKYPFTQLEVGQSFHVPSGENVDKTARSISTQVSNANKASKIPATPAATETVTKRRAKRDVAGNTIKDDSGKKIQEVYKDTQPVLIQTKHFVSRKVDATDPQGVGIRVFRIESSQV
jgi:hypothetical protein